MDQTQIIEQFKNLLAEGKTGEAIRFLKSVEGLDLNLKNLTLIESEYNAVRQSELKGVIDFQEARLKYNQINDRLLSLFDSKDPKIIGAKKRARLLWAGLALLPILIGVFWFLSGYSKNHCPEFETDKRNKILIFPFENVGNEPAKPESILRNRINELTSKNKLSASARLLSGDNPAAPGDPDQAVDLAKNCAVDLAVWGQYSSRADSIRLVMQYYFLQQDSWVSNQSISLKDVTSLQSGQMLKTLDDAIFSLCGILALREGDKALTKKWVAKVKEKDATDKLMMEWAEGG